AGSSRCPLTSGGPRSTALYTRSLHAALPISQRASRASSGATNLDLEIRETPQSISVVSSEQMRAFGADSVNEALRLATGVQVDRSEEHTSELQSREKLVCRLLLETKRPRAPS